MAELKELMTIVYELTIDSDTGEIIDTQIKSKEIGKKATKKKETKKEESSDPLVVLESNKLVFNNAALQFMDFQAGDKIKVAYKPVSSKTVPLIGRAEAFDTAKDGNVLTKSGTVAFRGVKNEELSNFGTEFRPSKYSEGLFILQSKDEPPTQIVADENIELNEDEVADLPFDVDVDEAEPIDSNFFQL